MRALLAILLAGCVALGACPRLAAAESAQGSKIILGYVERVIISDHGFSVKARLDTGAQTSSLDARNIERFRRDGESFVRFEVLDPDSGETVSLERPLVRNVRIRQHGGSFMRRPVVEMWLCVADMMEKVEVNLTPRDEFLYPFLIGRTAMAGRIIVDPSRSLTAEPQCDPEDFSR